MTYEQKLQERHSAFKEIMALWMRGNVNPDTVCKELAKISLQWSAEDFEKGYKQGRLDYSDNDLDNNSSLKQHLTSHGLVPQPPTDGE